MDTKSIMTLTVDVVSAYVSNNQIRVEDLPSVIGRVHAALSTIGMPAEAPPPPVELKPAVPIKKSVTHDYIISLEDGRKLRSLKRYLLTSHGMTPDDYRTKWGLPSDYPMVAPSYAAKRSELARVMGLGRHKPEAMPARATEVPAQPIAPKRTRAKKAA